MVLKQIITRNIQNHREVVLDLPTKGFIVFAGDNSNGKSVIVRTTRDILMNNIKKPQCRADLINRQSTFGEITYIREDDLRLTVHLTREAANTYVMLKYPEGEEIIRGLSDKSYMDLIKEFHWNTCEETGVSLNIAEGDDALLFYKTPNKLNGKVLQSANTDPVAELVLQSFEQTVKDARKFRDDAVSQTRIISSTLSSLKIYDMDELSKKREKLAYYYNILSAVYFPTLPEIKAVPKVRFVNYYKPNLPVIKYPRIINLSVNIPDIVPLAKEIESLRNMKCPTCGRGLDCAC